MAVVFSLYTLYFILYSMLFAWPNLTFIAIIVLITVWLIIFQIKFWRLKKRLSLFFSGRQAQDLEGVLAEQIKRWRACQISLQNLEKLSQDIQRISHASLHKVGLVRFNPFSRVGSDQSFSIALLDHQHNGLVISSLYTQDSCRIYAKPILKAASKYPLSEEEKEAIERAIKS